MIPKEVTDALDTLWRRDSRNDNYYWRVVDNFIKTTDRYVRDLEQHVDDLVAGQHGDSDYE